MEKLFHVFQFLDKWREEFIGFYLRGEVDLWWTIIKEKQNKPGLW